MSQTTIALPAVLKAVNGILTSLSAGKEIKVIFAGTPCTDGKTVYLGEPLLQSQDALDAYLSHGTHEIHHVLYSDFDEVTSLGGLHSLVNALEDVRIDAIGYKKYPGGYLWRNEHFSKMARAGQLPKINEHTSPGALLCLTCYWCMTALMLEYDCSKHYSEEAKNAFVQRFGQELFERIRQKAEESVRSPNTVAVIQCAREIAQLFSQAISQKVFSEQNKSSPDQHSGDSSSKGASVLSEGKGKTPKKDKQKSEDFDALFEDDDLKDADIHRAMEEDYKNYRGATGENPTGKAAVWPTVRSELSPRVDPESGSRKAATRGVPAVSSVPAGIEFPAYALCEKRQRPGAQETEPVVCRRHQSVSIRRVRASSVSCDVRAFRPQRLDDARRYENGIFVCPGNRRNGRFRKRMPKLGLCFSGC